MKSIEFIECVALLRGDAALQGSKTCCESLGAPDEDPLEVPVMTGRVAPGVGREGLSARRLIRSDALNPESSDLVPGAGAPGMLLDLLSLRPINRVAGDDGARPRSS